MQTIVELVTEALRQKAESRSSSAFTELVRRFQDLVFGYAYARCAETNLAQDITQEVFILAYRNLENLRRAAAFPGWIKQITARECQRTLRRQRTLRLAEPDSLAAPGPGPQSVFETEETRSEIRQAVDRLPESQRIPVVLYYIDGYSQQEVAHFLDLKLNTVKKRLQRGRVSLRKEMMNMIKDDFAQLRPSRDDKLIEKISLYVTFDTVARQGQLTILEQMLVDGIDINEKDATGRTLLHWAAENNHLEAVELLLKNGAARNIKDRSGKTARQLAAAGGHKTLLRLLDG